MTSPAIDLARIRTNSSRSRHHRPQGMDNGTRLIFPSALPWARRQARSCSAAVYPFGARRARGEGGLRLCFFVPQKLMPEAAVFGVAVFLTPPPRAKGLPYASTIHKKKAATPRSPLGSSSVPSQPKRKSAATRGKLLRTTSVSVPRWIVLVAPEVVISSCENACRVA